MKEVIHFSPFLDFKTLRGDFRLASRASFCSWSWIWLRFRVSHIFISTIQTTLTYLSILFINLLLVLNSMSFLIPEFNWISHQTRTKMGREYEMYGKAGGGKERREEVCTYSPLSSPSENCDLSSSRILPKWASKQYWILLSLLFVVIYSHSFIFIYY